MKDTHLKRISKQMSYLLRHNPDSAGLTLDAEGFVPISDLVTVLCQTHPAINEQMLRELAACVETDKQRFSIVDDCIRANYGHSLPNHIRHEPVEPPDVLLHGTSESAVASILANGLWPMKRQYVHLTTDPALANRVGARHGQPCVLRIDSRAAHRDGVVFYKANNLFWLTISVPVQYILAGHSD